MITLSRFLNADRELVEACFRIIGLLVEGIGLHAVEVDAPDYDRFKQDVSDCGAKMTLEASTPDLLIQAGTVIRAMEDYNKNIGRTVRQRNTEMQTIISMLTQAMIAVSDAGDRTAGRLQEIEKQLVTASVIEDVRLVKLRLAECLEKIREEKRTQTEQSTKVIEDLKKTIDQAPQWEPVSAGVDLTTGLPDRTAAETALNQCAAANEKAYAIIFIADRVQLINARFGYAAGDEVLKTIKAHIQKGLRPADRLYRWRGPSFLALLKRSDPADTVRTEMSRIATTRLEKTVEIGSKSVLLPIGVHSAIFAVSSSVRLLAHKIDAFVATHVPTQE
jgi:diguanylate cyclase (GGDEF)-like protein